MKKYRVSLALKVPVNFEVEVSAKSEGKAFGIALKKWENRENILEPFSEPLWDEATLDIKKSNNTGKLGDGIWIDEI